MSDTAAGTTLQGEWSDADKEALLAGLDATAQALEAIGASYDQTFGGLTFVFSPSLYWQAFVDETGDKISFRCVNERLVVHELGHIFNLRVGKRPMNALRSEGIYTDAGEFVTGLTRFGYYHRGRDGYLEGTQEHPTSIPAKDPASEDWADMWLNWVFGSFADDEAGRALGEWVEHHMKEWLS